MWIVIQSVKKNHFVRGTFNLTRVRWTICDPPFKRISVNRILLLPVNHCVTPSRSLRQKWPRQKTDSTGMLVLR